MKKNVLYLWALLCSAFFMAACSNDDSNGGGREGDELAVAAPPVAGTYRGNLDIVMIPDGSDQETEIAGGLTKNVTFTTVSDKEVKLELKDFELFMNGKIIKFGDIVIDKCLVKKGDGISYFSGEQDLTFEGDAAAFGTCDTSVEGEVEGGDIEMDIFVKVPTLNQTVKVSFKGVKLTTDSGTYYDFETWVPGVTGQTPENTYYEPEGWSSSNAGAQLLKGLSMVDKYSVTQTSDAHWGKSAARIETLDSKGGSLGNTKIPKVTTGSLFFGSFVVDPSNTLNSTKFGIPFDKKPLSLKGYYKYTPGVDYYACESVATCDVAVFDETKTDKFAISAVLYTTDAYQQDNSDCLTGVDIFNSDRIVAAASFTGGAQPNWQIFRLTLNYIKPFNPALKYRFAIICSSSFDGNNFNGAPGSVLTVDDFELISAATE